MEEIKKRIIWGFALIGKKKWDKASIPNSVLSGRRSERGARPFSKPLFNHHGIWDASGHKSAIHRT
jgi:hypothetical protein